MALFLPARIVAMSRDRRIHVTALIYTFLLFFIFLTLVIPTCLSVYIKYNVSVKNTTALLHKMLF